MEGNQDRRFWVTVRTRDNPVWDPPKFQMWGFWCYILARAKEEQRPDDAPRRILWEGKERALRAGQFTLAMRSTADILRWSAPKVCRYLKLLREMGMIHLEVAKGGTPFSILTVCKWREYQPDWPTRGTPVKRQRNASETSLEKEREGEIKNPLPKVAASHFDRLLRAYEGCRYWSEASGRMALRWAGERVERFLEFAEAERRRVSGPDYMPRPVNLYRRWKDHGTPAGSNGDQPVSPDKKWKVQVTENGVARTIFVKEKNLQGELDALRAKHGEANVRVVS